MALPVRSSLSHRLFKKVNFAAAAVGANSVSRQTVTVKGARMNMAILAVKPTDEANLFLIGARVTAKDTVEIDIWNNSAGSLTPAAQDYYFVGF